MREHCPNQWVSRLPTLCLTARSVLPRKRSHLVNIPELLAVIGAVCALLMVIGSLVLLYRGTITLKEANPDEAIKVQFKELIDVQTRYPALLCSW